MVAISSEARGPLQRPGWRATLLFAAAVLSGIYIWIRIALPVLLMQDDALAHHKSHLPMLLTHAVGGTCMLFLGAVALYIGATRRFFRGHKIFGYAYLVGGTVAALVALVLNFSNVHNNPSISAATGTLAAAWIAVAGMAYRAARNRRFEVHREWMVRSYVLTWTFVFCRLVQSSSAMSEADVAGVATAIWMTWVIPLLVCELALQWPRTSATA